MCEFGINFKRANSLSFNGIAVSDLMENFVTYMSCNGDVQKTYLQTKVNRAIDCVKHFIETGKAFTTDNVNAYMDEAYSKFAVPSQRLYAGAIAQFVDYCRYDGICDSVDSSAIRKHICEVFVSESKSKSDSVPAKRGRKPKAKQDVITVDEAVIARYETNDWDDFELESRNWKSWV